jgi:hypothetical protein
MRHVRHIPVAATALLLAAAPVVAADASKIVLEYVVKGGDQEIGWSRAVIKDTQKGKTITVTMKVETVILGMDVSLYTKNTARLDASGRAIRFEATHDTPRGRMEVSGKRAKGGFDVTRKTGDKTEKAWVGSSSFDHVSVEPAALEGKVGSSRKTQMLFTTSGKVRKVTIKILGRETRKILGKERIVIHYRLKASTGTLEEWRTDDGIIVKNRFSSPMGKLKVKLVTPLTP